MVMFKMTSNIEEEVRSYIIDIQQRLERGIQDDVSYDYILFRLDWIINLLARYTSDEQNTEINVFEIVIARLREVKDIISRENSVSTAYHVDRIFTGCHGRPRFDIQREHLELFVEQGFTSPAIANILGVSL